VKVDLAAYKGREQAFIKHCLLEDYLSSWSYKIGSAWDSLIYIDGFAGPWGATDGNYSDASFGIAVRVLKEAMTVLRAGGNSKVKALAVFVEKNPAAFTKLNAFSVSESTKEVTTVAIKGRFTISIPTIQAHIDNAGTNPFKFVFLDQKGWAAAPIQQIKSILVGRSSEVLFNLMTSFLTRFVDHDQTAASYQQLFGRDGVLELIRNIPKGTGEREEAVVREYCISLRQICGFRYVSQAVILEPEKEKVRYYLIFATNHPKGIEVFKSAEIKAARIQDDIRHEAKIEKTGQVEMLFDAGLPTSSVGRKLRKIYLRKAKERVIQSIAEAPDSGITFADLFCAAMTFPLVTPGDLQGWLRDFEPLIEVRLAGSSHRRKPSALENDRIFVLDRKMLLSKR
jgi:three-Cys-motif partner protein